MPRCDFNKVALHLYLNRTSAHNYSNWTYTCQNNNLLQITTQTNENELRWMCQSLQLIKMKELLKWFLF